MLPNDHINAQQSVSCFFHQHFLYIIQKYSGLIQIGYIISDSN